MILLVYGTNNTKGLHNNEIEQKFISEPVQHARPRVVVGMRSVDRRYNMVHKLVRY